MTTATVPQDRETTVLDTGPQAVLKLTQHPDLTYRDVAELLNISPATVARRVKDAKAELRENRQEALTAVVKIILTLCALICTAALISMAWL